MAVERQGSCFRISSPRRLDYDRIQSARGHTASNSRGPQAAVPAYQTPVSLRTGGMDHQCYMCNCTANNNEAMRSILSKESLSKKHSHITIKNPPCALSRKSSNASSASNPPSIHSPRGSIGREATGSIGREATGSIVGKEATRGSIGREGTGSIGRGVTGSIVSREPTGSIASGRYSPVKSPVSSCQGTLSRKGSTQSISPRDKSPVKTPPQATPNSPHSPHSPHSPKPQSIYSLGCSQHFCSAIVNEPYNPGKLQLNSYINKLHRNTKEMLNPAYKPPFIIDSPAYNIHASRAPCWCCDYTPTPRRNYKDAKSCKSPRQRTSGTQQCQRKATVKSRCQQQRIAAAKSRSAENAAYGYGGVSPRYAENRPRYSDSNQRNCRPGQSPYGAGQSNYGAGQRPQRQCQTPQRQCQSPQRQCQSPQRQCQSPQRQCQSPQRSSMFPRPTESKTYPTRSRSAESYPPKKSYLPQGCMFTSPDMYKTSSSIYKTASKSSWGGAQRQGQKNQPISAGDVKRAPEHVSFRLRNKLIYEAETYKAPYEPVIQQFSNQRNTLVAEKEPPVKTVTKKKKKRKPQYRKESSVHLAAVDLKDKEWCRPDFSYSRKFDALTTNNCVLCCKLYQRNCLKNEYEMCPFSPMGQKQCEFVKLETGPSEDDFFDV